MADDELTPGEIARSLKRIETKLEEVTGDHEKRLRELAQENARLREDFATQRGTIRGWLVGAAAAGGIGALSGLSALLGGG